MPPKNDNTIWIVLALLAAGGVAWYMLTQNQGTQATAPGQPGSQGTGTSLPSTLQSGQGTTAAPGPALTQQLVNQLNAEAAQENQ
jgi:hypothetical protein